MQVKLKHIDPTTLEIVSGASVVRKATEYKYEIWVKAQYGKRKKIISKNFVISKKYIYAGFIERIKKYCQKRNIDFEVMGERVVLKPKQKPHLPGIKFRDIQLQAIEAINKNQAGLVNLATAIGKTIFAAGLCSTYENPRVLFLCRSNDLVNQASETFSKFGFKNCKIGDGRKEITEKIVFATAQTYKNLDLVELSDRFDILIVDEAHKGSNIGGEYEKILRTCLAPIRVGLTATIPTDISKAMLIEGLIGPTTIQADTKYGIEEGILAKPKIELLVIPESKGSSSWRTYKDAYEYGVVKNSVRNNIIADGVKKEIDSGNSCLLFCVEIEHIRQISMALEKKGVEHECVYGDIDSKSREKIKKDIAQKKILCVISSVVWVEGLDIPSLDRIFNASGQKASEALLQKVGRVLRVTEKKKTATVYDCLDQGKWLGDHTVKRLIVYKNMGWV